MFHNRFEDVIVNLEGRPALGACSRSISHASGLASDPPTKRLSDIDSRFSAGMAKLLLEKHVSANYYLVHYLLQI